MKKSKNQEWGKILLIYIYTNKLEFIYNSEII